MTRENLCRSNLGGAMDEEDDEEEEG